MDADAYRMMASHEGHHWWFVGRRSVIASLIKTLELPARARILEAGCGTGGNLGTLRAYGDVVAFEPHEPAVEIARAGHPDLDIRMGSLPDDVPFGDEAFDLVAALDVLEHIEGDEAAIKALISRVKPGGYLLLTVPTHQSLWGQHDRRLHHVRRYQVRRLRELCTGPGLELRYFGAFNTLLAPLAVAARLAERISHVSFGNQERLPPAPLNTVLAWLFGLEGGIVPRFRLPVGLSHAVIVHRTL
jgi:SAM-dependent methyltransferase